MSLCLILYSFSCVLVSLQTCVLCTSTCLLVVVKLFYKLHLLSLVWRYRFKYSRSASGTPSGKGLSFTVYPLSRLNTYTVQTQVKGMAYSAPPVIAWHSKTTAWHWQQNLKKKYLCRACWLFFFVIRAGISNLSFFCFYLCCCQTFISLCQPFSCLFTILLSIRHCDCDISKEQTYQ